MLYILVFVFQRSSPATSDAFTARKSVSPHQTAAVQRTTSITQPNTNAPHPKQNKQRSASTGPTAQKHTVHHSAAPQNHNRVPSQTSPGLQSNPWAPLPYPNTQQPRMMSNMNINHSQRTNQMPQVPIPSGNPVTPVNPGLSQIPRSLQIGHMGAASSMYSGSLPPPPAYGQGNTNVTGSAMYPSQSTNMPYTAPHLQIQGHNILVQPQPAPAMSAINQASAVNLRRISDPTARQLDMRGHQQYPPHTSGFPLGSQMGQRVSVPYSDLPMLDLNQYSAVPYQTAIQPRLQAPAQNPQQQVSCMVAQNKRELMQREKEKNDFAKLREILHEKERQKEMMRKQQQTLESQYRNQYSEDQSQETLRIREELLQKISWTAQSDIASATAVSTSSSEPDSATGSRRRSGSLKLPVVTVDDVEKEVGAIGGGKDRLHSVNNSENSAEIVPQSMDTSRLESETTNTAINGQHPVTTQTNLVTMPAAIESTQKGDSVQSSCTSSQKSAELTRKKSGEHERGDTVSNSGTSVSSKDSEVTTDKSSSSLAASSQPVSESLQGDNIQASQSSTSNLPSPSLVHSETTHSTITTTQPTITTTPQPISDAGSSQVAESSATSQPATANVQSRPSSANATSDASNSVSDTISAQPASSGSVSSDSVPSKNASDSIQSKPASESVPSDSAKSETQSQPSSSSASFEPASGSGTSDTFNNASGSVPEQPTDSIGSTGDFNLDLLVSKIKSPQGNY